MILQKADVINYKSENGTEYSSSISTVDINLDKRMKALVELGLAFCFTNNNPPIYYLEKKWDEKLRSIGRYNSFLQARSNLLFTLPCELEQYTPEVGKIQGFVSKNFLMNDESVWTNAIVLEIPKTKKAYYIPLRFPPSTSLLNKMISVECTKNQSGKLSPVIKVINSPKLTINKSNNKTTSYEVERTI